MPEEPRRSINRLMPASLVVQAFGGLTKLAQAFEPPKSLSSVQRWVESGYVPSRHQLDTLEAARRAEVELSPSIFLPTQEALDAEQGDQDAAAA